MQGLRLPYRHHLLNCDFHTRARNNAKQAIRDPKCTGNQLLYASVPGTRGGKPEVGAVTQTVLRRLENCSPLLGIPLEVA